MHGLCVRQEAHHCGYQWACRKLAGLDCMRVSVELTMRTARRWVRDCLDGTTVFLCAQCPQSSATVSLTDSKSDILISSQPAYFVLPETKIGLIPGAGGTQRLTAAIGKYRVSFPLPPARSHGGRQLMNAVFFFFWLGHEKHIACPTHDCRGGHGCWSRHQRRQPRHSDPTLLGDCVQVHRAEQADDGICQASNLQR